MSKGIYCIYTDSHPNRVGVDQTPSELFTTEVNKDILNELEAAYSKLDKLPTKKEKSILLKKILDKQTFDQLKTR